MRHKLFAALRRHGPGLGLLLLAVGWFTVYARTGSCPLTLLTGRSGAASLATGQAAPAWQLTDLEGRPHRSADYAGKVVLVNFWATWCGPCRAELQNLAELHRRHGAAGLAILGFTLDAENERAVRDLQQRHGLAYPLLRADSATADAWGGVSSIPTSFLVDRQGRVVGRQTGALDLARLEAWVAPALRSAPPVATYP